MVDVKTLIPHREPFLFVDRLISSDEKGAVGEYTFTLEKNDFFRGHFPGLPVTPGVVLLESMAQVCAASVTYSKILGDGVPVYYFAGIDNVKFIKPVHPGDTFESRVTYVKRRGNFLVFTAEGFVNGEKVIRADMKCMADTSGSKK